MAETKFYTNVLTEDVVSTASPEVQKEVLGVLLNASVRRIEPSVSMVLVWKRSWIISTSKVFLN